MAVEHINETDTLNQGRIKINAVLDQSNASSEKVDAYNTLLEQGINDAKQIATDAGQEAIQIATDATAGIEATANQANANSQTAINTADNAVSTVNQNKQEFDQLRNDFDGLVAEAGDSNPEIVQARTDTSGIKQVTLANRLSVDFADRMTKADGVEMLSGQTNVKKMMDFGGKTAGNTATNPHQAYSDFTAKSLKKPSDIWNEIGQTDYNKLASRDDSGISTGSSANGVIPQQLYKLNAVETVKTLAPQLFEGLSATDAVKFIKDNFVSLVLTIRGKASSPNNKNLKVSTYVASADTWTTQVQGDATEYTDFTTQINDVNYIGPDGFVYALAYTDLTNGVTASNIDIDYVGMTVEVTLEAEEILEKQGFAKAENVVQKADFVAHENDTDNPHSVTKNQVGLGDVPNYAAATDAEAVEGVSDNKLVTPKGINSFYLNRTKIRRQKWDEGLNWIAHRGNNSTYPENSKLAFMTAYNHWGIETDIQVTSDGQWVCMHDPTVDRTTNGTGTVASKTLAQFRALRIDTGGAGTNLQTMSDADKVPPTFDEYLQICKQMNKVPIIEIKDYAYTATHYNLLKETLNKWGYDETNCVIATFSYTILAKIREMYPNMELHYFVNAIDANIINQLTALGVPAVCSCAYNNASVTESNVRLVHAAGFKFAVWTVPDDSFAKMIGLGVDYITTNSKSGNLRWEKLTLLNGFTDNRDSVTYQRMNSNFVQEMGGGIIHLEFNVLEGVNTQNTAIARFPDWANPMYRQWSICTIRTSSGGAMGSFDINGRNLQGAGSGEVGTIAVGLNWSSRSTWATGSTTYKVN
ncbi:glycerophosphodiester phosphodiesterase family protein [Enterococcus mediterraneensis]|uniref:glycerophosphodiester phosphodiesterase family protein n=1 Tax=Enterococcus mediterraneensis TaxID=2364791 RepID=UPI000F070B9B|nr:glycerophosphodiester phosphodiesterase family protein [Enterococcus mediterraneensis]